MSDTPRTEAIEDQYFENSIQGDEIFVHARQLERELVAARAELAEAKAQRDKVRKPMTDGEIYECYRAMFITTPTDSVALRTIKYFARAIERAHGIGSEKVLKECGK